MAGYTPTPSPSFRGAILHFGLVFSFFSLFSGRLGLLLEYKPTHLYILFAVHMLEQ